ncbi:MAG: hypothetical protein H0W03_07960 [Solirubrobacterales bacterium]|nr:hypothetical protein [Solirubrobacterales bacterium]
MRRTNIYLEDGQLEALRRVGEQRAASVAELVREAVDEWLHMRGVTPVDEDAWQRRFDDLLSKRREIADRLALHPEEVDARVSEAVREVRSARRR